MNREPDEQRSLPEWDAPLSQRAYHFFAISPKKDPWTQEDDAAARHPAANKICLRCLHPDAPAAQTWFCPNCGEPTGDCVNSMHYLYIFSMGALARRGVTSKPEKGLRGFLENLFLVIFFTAQYGIFAPVYWFWLVRKATGKPICADTRVSLENAPAQPPPQFAFFNIAPRLWQRLLTFCAITTIGLVAAFAIVAAVEHRKQQERIRQTISVRVFLAPLRAAETAYLEALDSVLTPNARWFFGSAESPETLATTRDKIRSVLQANANLLRSVDGKLNELNHPAIANDTASGMSADTIRTLRITLRNLRSEMQTVLASEAEKLNRMHTLLEWLEKNPGAWARQPDGSIRINDNAVLEQARALIAEINAHTAARH